MAKHQRRITNRFMELLAAKARRENRGRISIAQVIEETGLARGTVDGYVHNTITRYDAHVIQMLCDYLDCKPGDLLVMEEVEDPQMKTALVRALVS